MVENIKNGRVFLIGAGPGDPELLTLKAAKALRRADVVLADRLASEMIITEHAKAGAEILYVGKECGRGISTPQPLINELLVMYARQGKTVARLKGGDVSVFSNILDELEFLRANNILYEIIPGITAASGAAAYAGMPLTARGHSTAVRYLTAYKNELLSESYWRELALTEDTLVFYMSVKALPNVIAQLVKHTISNEKGIAVIEQATTPQQRVHIFNFKDAEEINALPFASPSLIIIGRVVALHQQYKWLENSAATELYFKPVKEIPKNNLQYAV